MVEEGDYWFQSELRTMLWVAGDSKRASPETCRVVEVSMGDQLIGLINKAHEIAVFRTKDNVRPEQVEIEPVHILFILRKNTVLISNILGHMKAKDFASVGRWASSTADAETVDGIEETVQSVQRGSKRLTMLYDALKQFDVHKQFETLLQTTEYDKVKNYRLAKLNSRISYMSQADYVEFSEARQISFTSKSLSRRLRDYLCSPGGPFCNLRFSVYAFEIVSFIAGEVVHNIVESAIIVQSECGSTPWLSNPCQTLSNVQMQLQLKIKQRLIARGMQQSDSNIPAAIKASALQPGHIQEALRRLALTKRHPWVKDSGCSGEAEQISLWIVNRTDI